MGHLDWTDISDDDLPVALRDICETVAGADTPKAVAERLVEAFGGSSVYVPALRDLRRRALEQKARRLYDAEARGGHGNAGEVCRTLGVSRRHLKTLLGDSPPARS